MTSIKFYCPSTGEPLNHVAGGYVRPSDGHIYPMIDHIPHFTLDELDPASQSQQEHYDRVARAYQKNLAYPHTIAYMTYLDGLLRKLSVEEEPLGLTAELCCGLGEALHLFPEIAEGVGVDISANMLKIAYQNRLSEGHIFIKASALNLPLADASFDTVCMLGGIHHVPDRTRLFQEVSRILKPGGRFVFREPYNDFWLWRFLRAIIYKISPTLDADNERPLRASETLPLLQRYGFRQEHWEPAGLLGFCLFMNSDVLVFNRFFKYFRHIDVMVKWMAKLDAAMLKRSFFSSAGLQIIGVFRKL